MKDLVVVTATTNPEKAFDCIKSWGDVPLVVVYNGQRRDAPMPLPHIENRDVMVVGEQKYLGTVPAFNLGVQEALKLEYQIIACLHDDLEITDPDWAKKVVTHFKRHPECGLAGFGGAIGLGDADIYQKPYAPQQLARVGFRSNLRDAELHGIRSLLPEKVACLDGFSQIGRREFWEGWKLVPDLAGYTVREGAGPIWQQLEDLGVTHHLYDGLLGCYAKRLGWETWYLPISCHHFGGRTAVGDAGYNTWAQSTIPGGDHGFWEHAHKVGYEEFRDILPLRV